MRIFNSIVVGLLVAFSCPSHAAARVQDEVGKAQSSDETIEKKAAPDPGEVSQPPPNVSVEAVVEDSKIAKRLSEIMTVTGFFRDINVEVKQGVAFLGGVADLESHKAWAGDLARSTEDVVAVVNKISVTAKPFWDFSSAYGELDSLGREITHGLPQILFALAILVLSWFSAKAAVWAFKPWVNRRIKNGMLRSVMYKAILIPFVLLGIYLALRVSGLSRLALTVLGGTGVFGLVVGFAFRDIAENFLASLLISTQRPFREDDLIEVNGQKGYVQKVTTRGTTIMTQDGNHIQIPNSMIYKSIVTNFTSNPRMRVEFGVGIGYDSPVADSQQLLFEVVTKHPAVIQDPEPMVLVDSLGASTINLKILAWIDSQNHSPLKVRSSLIRLAKNALVSRGIEMPDEDREIIIKGPVNIQMLDQGCGKTDGQRGVPGKTTPAVSAETARPGIVPTRLVTDDEPTSIAAEGGLKSEDDAMVENAKQARSPDESENLLDRN